MGIGRRAPQHMLSLHDAQGRELVTYPSQIDAMSRLRDGTIRWVLVGGEKFYPDDQFEAVFAYVQWTTYWEKQHGDTPKRRKRNETAAPTSGTSRTVKDGHPSES